MADSPSRLSPALIPVNSRIIRFDEAGVPHLAVEPVLTKAHIRSVYLAVAAQPYEVTDPLDPDFGLYDGMTIAEVLVRKQLLNAARTGDVEAAMDRLIGKPMTHGENLNLTTSYEDFLRGLVAKTAKPILEGQVVEEPEVFGDLA